MSSLPLERNNITYTGCLQQSIQDIEALIKKEYRSSLYFEKLLPLVTDKSCSNIISNIITSSRKNSEILKSIYMNITDKNYIYTCGPICISNSFKKDLIWAILDKFQVIKIYNSLLDNLTEARHKSLVLQIIQEERTNISDLNSLLIDM